MKSTNNLQKLAWGLVGWCVVFLVVLAGRPSFTNASLVVRGVADPVVALQMARSADDVEAVLGDAPSPDREVMRVKQYVDFGLIAGYCGLALAICLALRRSGRGRVAWLLGIVAALAGFNDVRENLITLRVVNLDLSQINPGDAGPTAANQHGEVGVPGGGQRGSGGGYGAAAGLVFTDGCGTGVGGGGVDCRGIFYNSILVWGGLLMIPRAAADRCYAESTHP